MRLEEMSDEAFRRLANTQLAAIARAEKEAGEMKELFNETAAEMLRRWGHSTIDAAHHEKGK